MKVMPICYVADLAASARFYGALGLVPGDSSRSGNWIELNASGGMLALHTARTSEQDVPGRLELSFEAQPARRSRHAWRAMAGRRPGCSPLAPP
jgi:extradiol dioxygenase family protein